MTAESLVHVRRSVLMAAGAGLVAIGVAAGYIVFARQAAPPGGHVAVGPGTSPAATATPPRTSGAAATPIVVRLSAEARARAGIETTPATGGAAAAGTLRAPGIVEANAYQRVAVTPFVAGRVTRVAVELGQRVQRGSTVAEVFSPELAEAQARYVAARAALTSHERELERTAKLVEIGSASRQELERLTAEHAARRTEVASGATRLRLLGMTDAALDRLTSAEHAEATVRVPAPLSGVVTERTANPGMAVDASTPLATIVDLSTVWVIADVAERDLSRVRVGSAAAITAVAFPDLALTGRVNYIDAQLSAATRTAKVRIEVANPEQRLRLGMLAEARLGGEAGQALTVTIPRAAVQSIAERSVVYVADPATPDDLVERTVRLGEAHGDRVAVVAGLEAGERVVSAGSFHVRAERERLGLGDPAPTPDAPSAAKADEIRKQTATITVTKDGFTPATVTLRAGVPARLTFLRTSDETCATQVVVPALKIARPLPLNTPVVVELAAAQAGSIEFACGMDMLKGAIVIE